jgi:hypothetical protein
METTIDEQSVTKTDADSQSKFAIMPTRMRKFMLTVHVIFSVGWLGAVLSYLALAITGLVSRDIRMVKVVYPALELIGWYVIVPSSVAALLTGLIQSLGTNWGVFRYYWISMKFLLTFVASIVLVNHMPVVSQMASMVTTGKLSGLDFDRMQIQLLIHAAGGLLILIFATVLSVYKPWGKTMYGWRNKGVQELPGDSLITGKSWGLKVLFGVTGLVILFIVLHIITGGMGGHH